MDHANARRKRVKGCGKFGLRAVYENISLVPSSLIDNIHPEKNLHQGAFAGSVFANKTKDLTFVQREVDIGQDLIPKEVLFDISHLQQWRIVIDHSFTPIYK